MESLIEYYFNMLLSVNVTGFIFAGLVLVSGSVIAHIIAYMMTHALRLMFKKNQLDLGAFLISNQLPKLHFPIQILLFIWSLLLSLTFFNVFDVWFDAGLRFAKVSTYIMLVWLGLRLAQYIEVFLIGKADQSTLKFDDLLAPLISKTIKGIVVLIGLISIAEILNLPLASLLTGLGIGGIAIAMAAKDTIANIFGSLTVVTDRPFSIGDWVKVNNVEGTVEELGFRSTRIRTFYNSLVSVPNSVLLTASVDNMGERTYRRFNTKIAITYGTPVEKIEAFCAGIRELIQLHKDTRKDYYIVRLNEFAASSLDILLYVFFQTPSWEAELDAREQLMLDIIRLAQNLGVDFAFPTQTLYLNQDEESSKNMASYDAVQKQISNGQKKASHIAKTFRT